MQLTTIQACTLLALQPFGVLIGLVTHDRDEGLEVSIKGIDAFQGLGDKLGWCDKAGAYFFCGFSDGYV
jgi:hypothetical protein